MEADKRERLLLIYGVTTYLAIGNGVARGLGDGTGETLLLLGLSECNDPVD